MDPESITIIIKAEPYGWSITAHNHGLEYSIISEGTSKEVLEIARRFMHGNYYGAMAIHRTPKREQ